jgi:hypothetical protein
MFLLELIQDDQISLCSETALTVGTMQRSDGFGLAMPR